MKRKKRINVKLRQSGNTGLFHNSREDVQSIMKVCNILIDEINKMDIEINELRGIVATKP